MNIKSIWAWVIRPFTEESPMPDEALELTATTNQATSDANIATRPDQAAPVSVVLVPATVAGAPAADLVGTLEIILKALGHELPVFWDEAVALARKAL